MGGLIYRQIILFEICLRLSSIFILSGKQRRRQMDVGLVKRLVKIMPGLKLIADKTHNIRAFLTFSYCSLNLYDEKFVNSRKYFYFKINRSEREEKK